MVLYEFLYEGIQTGPLATPSGEVMGSGRRFRVDGAGVLEIRDRRVAAERIYFNTAQFLGQLGVGRQLTAANTAVRRGFRRGLVVPYRRGAHVGRCP